MAAPVPVPSAVMTPVELTLEPGVSYAAGAATAAYATTTSAREQARETFPPRNRQNHLTLQRPDQPHALVEFLHHNNIWDALSPDESLRVVAAPHILADVDAIRQRQQQISHGVGNMGAAAAAAQQQQQQQDKSATLTAPDSAGIAAVARIPRLMTSDTGPIVFTPAQQAQQFALRGLGAAAAAATSNTNNAKRTANDRHHEAFARDYEERWHRLWADDSELDPALAFELRPDDYPGFAQLRAHYGALYAQRAELQQRVTAAFPRREIVELTREYLAEYRVRPRAHLSEQACANGAAGKCLFEVLAFRRGMVGMGYVAREFLLPAEQAARERALAHDKPEPLPPPRLCIDCLLFAWSQRVHQNISLKNVPTESFNTFCVRVGEGQYAPDVMLPIVVGELATGIEGHVPVYVTHARQYQMRTTGGFTESYLAEVGQVFWRSLSEANACLGARKAAPLLGADVPRFVRPASAATKRDVLLTRTKLERAANSAAWIRFVRALPTGILADRVMLIALPQQQQQQQQVDVPAAWLRRSLSLSLPEPANALATLSGTAGAAAAVRTAIVEQNTAAQLAWLARILQCHVSELHNQVALLADAVFSTFERSVACWLHLLKAAHDEGLTIGPLVALWQQRRRDKAANNDDELGGMAIPPRVDAALECAEIGAARAYHAVACAILPPDEDGDGNAAASFVLWAVAMWRCAVTLLFERHVRPWSRQATHIWVDEWTRRAQYFRDVHLDLFALCTVRPSALSDTVLLSQQAEDAAPPPLARVYPQANRVCCVEELPSFAGGALIASQPWFDRGNRKSQDTMEQAIDQTFILKLKPEKCQLRQFHVILLRNATVYPAFWRLVELVLRVVLLGNMPHALSRPPLGVRVRLTLDLSPVFRRTSSEALKAWVPAHRLTVMFALREYFLAAVDADPVYDQLCSQSIKWTQFKTLVRLANGHCRRVLARIVAALPLRATMDWASIERTTTVESSGKVRAVSSGLLFNYHERSASMFIKLKKDRWEGIVIKKFTASEKKLQFDEAALTDWLQHDGRLEAFHLAAWCAAQNSQTAASSLRAHAMIETRWLKALGMTRAGFADVRRWQFEYQMYDTADDNYKNKALQLYARAPRDFFIFKTYLRLVDDYRRERMTLLSARLMRAQALALRVPPCLEPYAATLPLSGIVNFCGGCQSWAHRVLRPTPAILGSLMAAGTHRDGTGARAPPRTHYNTDALQSLAYSIPAPRHLNTDSSTPVFSSIIVSSVQNAYLNPFNAQLYCRRIYHRLGAKDFVVPKHAGTAAATARRRRAPPTAHEDDDYDDDDDVADDDDGGEGLIDAVDLENVDDAATWAQRNARWLQRVAAEALAVEQPIEDIQRLATKRAIAEDISELAKLDRFSCLRPLIRVDLLGAMRRQRYVQCSLCVYCGHVTEVHNCNVTNAGISCGRHPLYHELPLFHRVWHSLAIAPDATANAMSFLVANKQQRRCLLCAGVAEARVIVYDFVLHFACVDLCGVHKRALEPIIPLRPMTNTVHHHSPPVAVPPIRVDTLLKALAAYNN